MIDTSLRILWDKGSTNLAGLYLAQLLCRLIEHDAILSVRHTLNELVDAKKQATIFSKNQFETPENEVVGN